MKSFHIETIRTWRLNIISLGIIFIVMQLFFFFFFYFYVFKALGFKLALTHFIVKNLRREISIER